MVGISDLRGLFQPEYFYDFVHPCNASEEPLQWPGEGSSKAQAPSLQDSCPITSSERVRIFSSKRFSTRSIADMRVLSSWIYRKGERGKRRREQTSHHCQDSEETVQPAEESKQQDTATVARVKRHSKLIFFK